MTMRLNPYLQFRTGSREVLEFYAEVFGGTPNTMTFGAFGMDGPLADLIMHGVLETPAGFTIMASDTPPEMMMLPNSTPICLSGDDAETLRDYWSRLSVGARIETPLAVQMWGDEYGALVDKYGTQWLVDISPAPASDTPPDDPSDESSDDPADDPAED